MIRTVLFDLGNVIVHFSHEVMCEQIGAVLDRSGPDARRLLIDSGLMWDFERGRVTEADILQAVARETGREGRSCASLHRLQRHLQAE